MTTPPAIKISNREFLEALAGKDWKRVPIQWGEQSWWARPAGKNIDKLDPADSCYFTVSLFMIPPGEKFTRRKELFERQFVFVIDDVGTKLNEAAVRATMPPSTYELETSPGNWQFGYKLTDGYDARALEALVDAIVGDPDINPSLKDPGMKGVTRVVRLPVGSNNKPKWKDAAGKGWPHRLTVWEPSREYSVGQLAFWLGVDLSEEALEKLKGAGGTRKATEGEIGDDPLMKLFDARGMLLDPNMNDNGFVTVVCPWAETHSDARNEAGYRPGRRGFQCHHGHCESKGMPELMAWAIETATAEERAEAFGEVFPEIADDDPRLAAAERAAVVAEMAKDEKVREMVKEVLADWAFVVDLHRYGHVKTNRLLPEKTFNALNPDLAPYGASGQKSAAAVFINDLKGPHCKTAAYEPGKPAIYVDPADGQKVFNTWREGPIKAWPLDMSESDIRPWLDHVAFVLPDRTARKMFFDWAAFLFQYPGKKINWSYLLTGGQGVGKDLMLRPIYKILGTDNCQAITAKDLESDYTDWAENQVVIVEELPSFHKRDVYDWLKRFVAEGVPYFRVNKKNIAQYNVRNLQNWFIFSNHDDALALEADDRRYFVYQTPATKRDPDYYKMLAATFNDPIFQAKVLTWLLERDLSAFNPGEAPPMTEAKMQMLENTKHPTDHWLDAQFETGKYANRKIIKVSEILTDAQSAGKHSVGIDVARGLNQTRIGRWLRDNGWFQLSRRRLPNSKPVRLWIGPAESITEFETMSPEVIEARYRTDAGVGFTVIDGGAETENANPF